MPQLYRLTDTADAQLSTVNYQLSIGDDINALVANLAQRIFNGEKITYDPDLLHATVKPYLDGITKGYGKSLADVDWDTPDFKTLQKLTENVFQFSASKDFNLLRDMTNALKGSDGKLRSFDEFRQEIDRMNAKYNVNWLRTEYNQAVAASQCAARWTDFESCADKNPFLQYQAVMDANTRAEHAALNGVIKRYDDDFWDKYYPPNGWGCRCEVIQLPGKNHRETPDADLKYCKVDPMFQVNVGKKGVVFPKGHPYFMSQCQRCNGVNLKLYQKGNPQCEACLKAMEQDQKYVADCEKSRKRCQGRKQINDTNTNMKKWVTREEKGVGTYSVSKDNDRLFINSECDKKELAANTRAAKAILDAFPKAKIEIRPHIIKKDLKNPEYRINGILADRKGVTSEKGIAAGFNKAIKQGSSVVVIDFDDSPKTKTRDLRWIDTAINLGNRIEDFKEELISECYLIHKNRVLRITVEDFGNDEKSSKLKLTQILKEFGL